MEELSGARFSRCCTYSDSNKVRLCRVGGETHILGDDSAWEVGVSQVHVGQRVPRPYVNSSAGLISTCNLIENNTATPNTPSPDKGKPRNPVVLVLEQDHFSSPGWCGENRYPPANDRTHHSKCFITLPCKLPCHDDLPSIHTQTHLFYSRLQSEEAKEHSGCLTNGIPWFYHCREPLFPVEAFPGLHFGSRSTAMSGSEWVCCQQSQIHAESREWPGSEARCCPLRRSPPRGTGERTLYVLFGPSFFSFFSLPLSLSLSFSRSFTICLHHSIRAETKIKTSTKHLYPNNPNFTGLSWTPSRNRQSLGTRPPAPEK